MDSEEQGVRAVCCSVTSAAPRAGLICWPENCASAVREHTLQRGGGKTPVVVGPLGVDLSPFNTSLYNFPIDFAGWFLGVCEARFTRCRMISTFKLSSCC